MPEPRRKARSRAERSRQPTEVRRQLVVEAARVLIADKGLVGINIREIAAASGVSTGTITYHFSGVNEILVDVVALEQQLFSEPLLAKMDDAPSAAAALQLLIDGMLTDAPEVVTHWRLWRDYWAAAVRAPELAQWHAEQYELWRTRVTAIVARGVESGELQSELDPAVVALEFTALLDGLAVQAFLTGSPVTPDVARARLTDYVQRRLIGS
ncbi:MAG: TetR family transcriptional regulator [Actinomycetia bacterium]|nr:TetR family transcriptional regulator [Actinomycetes bacterium]